MRKRIQLEVSTRREIRDIINKAQQLREDSAYFEPGGSYSGGSGNLSDFVGSPFIDGFGGNGEEQPCWSRKQITAALTPDGLGNYSVPNGMQLQEAFFDGLSASGKYITNPDGTITPLGNLVEGTEVTGLFATD